MIGSDIQSAQQRVYDFFLESVKTDPAAEVLATFRRLFVDYTQSTESDLPVALYTLVIKNNPQEFQFTLKRICYILINNWGLQRNVEAIRELIKTFEDRTLLRPGLSVVLKRLRGWMRAFVNSDDFKGLKLFAARYDETKHWSEHYTSYLLVPQYLNLENPLEQREAARTLSIELKEQFRFDLAMYTARSQFNLLTQSSPNPTLLGEAALNLVKLLLVKPGRFSYPNLANLFRQQVRNLAYQDYKRALLHYLAFALPRAPVSVALRQRLPEPVLNLYPRHNGERVDDAIALRTCNRVIDMLTTEDRQQPSRLFNLVLAQGNPLVLVILLLKVALYCPNVQAHLELRIADLIRYYEKLSQTDCNWVINFFEVFRVTFSVYAETTRYNLVQIRQESEQGAMPVDLDAYRVFSQRRQGLIYPTPEMIEAVAG
ncbi:MAG: hypothetical protein AAFR15_14670 [Cyanobacteria bacterium J06627_15]